MTHSLAGTWQESFSRVARDGDEAQRLKQAATQGRLADWTVALTSCVVATCREMGWMASAIGHKTKLLPVDQSEYLALDVMAFGAGEKNWRFPVAVAELENSQDADRVAYSLWKVLIVRADLRIVFCYRRRPEDGPALVREIEREVVHAMALSGRVRLEGETLLVVGSTNEAEYFPYGFFKWWQLDAGTGRFCLAS
ncbi:MAG: hypothetical protein DCC65_10755 [Planctomycetota bacterium]|nr:MAG: hypothetical protein DCC65_10755 [Planctomycetota bacterium]